jgi:proteasome alpha subunit
MGLEEAISLAVNAVRVASEGEIDSKVVKVAVIPSETKTFRRLTDEEVEGYLK